MFLALRELRFARGRFTLMGIVIALIADGHDVLEHCDKVFEMVDGKLSTVAPSTPSR